MEGCLEADYRLYVVPRGPVRIGRCLKADPSRRHVTARVPLYPSGLEQRREHGKEHNGRREQECQGLHLGGTLLDARGKWYPGS